MNEGEEYKVIKARVEELMSGGFLGDGIGPGNASFKINEEFGTSYSGREIWTIWRQGKPWANSQDDPPDVL